MIVTGYGQEVSEWVPVRYLGTIHPYPGIADYYPLLTKYSYQLLSFAPTTRIGTSGTDETTNTKSPAKMKGPDTKKNGH